MCFEICLDAPDVRPVAGLCVAPAVERLAPGEQVREEVRLVGIGLIVRNVVQHPWVHCVEAGVDSVAAGVVATDLFSEGPHAAPVIALYQAIGRYVIYPAKTKSDEGRLLQVRVSHSAEVHIIDEVPIA